MCAHPLRRIFIDLTDEFRCLKFILYTVPFPAWNICHLKPSSLQFLSYIRDEWLGDFKIVAFSESKCSLATETIISCFFISSDSLSSNTFTYNGNGFVKSYLLTTTLVIFANVISNLITEWPSCLVFECTIYRRAKREVKIRCYY